jgi:hypothetical protein
MPTDQLTDPRAQRTVAVAEAEAIRTKAAAEVAILAQQLQTEGALGQAQVRAAELASGELVIAAMHHEQLLGLELEMRRAASTPAEPATTEAPPSTAAVDGDTSTSTSDAMARAKAEKLYRRAILVPLTCGTSAAFIGQVFAYFGPVHRDVVGQLAGPDAAWGKWLALAMVIMAACLVEGMQLGLLGMARAARLDNDSPTLYRAGAWLVAAYAIGTNLKHWSPDWHAFTQPDVSFLGWFFGVASFLSVFGWELQEYRLERSRKAAKSRELFGEQKPIPPRPVLGIMRRVVAPVHTTVAWAIAVRDRITDAEAALARATVTLDERAKAKAAKRAKRDGKRAERKADRRAKTVTAVRTDTAKTDKAPAKPVPAKADAPRAISAKPVPAKADEVPAKPVPAKAAKPIPAKETAAERTQGLATSVPDFPDNWAEIVAAGVRIAREEMDGKITGTGKREDLGARVRKLGFTFDNVQRGHLHQAVKRTLEAGAAA